MKSDRLNNVNIITEELLASPSEVKQLLPLSSEAESFVFECREQIDRILRHEDSRLLVVAGP